MIGASFFQSSIVCSGLSPFESASATMEPALTPKELERVQHQVPKYLQTYRFHQSNLGIA